MSEAALTTPTSFDMGSPIPEWLIVAEPQHPDAPRGHFRFGLDVDVVETSDYFVVVPRSIGGSLPPVIDTTGMGHHNIYAPGKPVRVMVADQVVLPLGVNSWVKTYSGIGVAPPPPLPEAAPAPRPNLWQRLRWALRGR